MVTYIVLGWILIGLMGCYVARDRIDTRGEQLQIMIFAPLIFCKVLFDCLINVLNGPAIGRKK